MKRAWSFNGRASSTCSAGVGVSPCQSSPQGPTNKRLLHTVLFSRTRARQNRPARAAGSESSAFCIARVGMAAKRA
eukprot:15468758-Alexandrium_andersonii.AAC.1